MPCRSLPVPVARAALAAFLATLALGPSFAQNEVTGTVQATLAGEERTWSTVLLEGEETGLPTATWSETMGVITTVSIQAHPEPRFVVEGALSIEITAFEFPSDCPCTYADASVTYWTSDSMFEALYTADDATVVLTSVDPLGDDAYAIEGTFEATLAFVPTIQDGPDPSDTIDVSGRFAIDRLPRDTSREEALE